MIEISHKQARYLLRENEDRGLPDEQWAALQAHLERCPECSAYHDRMARLERDLRREMHVRWTWVNFTQKDLPKWIVGFRTARKQHRQWSLYATMGGLVIITILFLRSTTSVFAPPPTPIPTVPKPSPTPIQANVFRGLVAFQASPSGNSDIFLLNQSGSSPGELTNLTNDPAQDIDPAWSPDGEWIAFLSDRSGKGELYAINVAGTRLTQLTNDPHIDWQGPLSWSADGKMIGLAGHRLEQNNERWLYAVPLSGTGPISLPGTRNDPGWVHFSPSQPLLATSSGVYDYSNGWSLSGWYGLPTLENLQVPGFPSGAKVDFDWAMGGNSLVYLFNTPQLGDGTPAESQIRLSPVLGLNNRDTSGGYSSQIAAVAPAGDQYKSITSMPGGTYAATLLDLHHTGCWTVRFINLPPFDLPPIDFPSLCVDSPLERASWQAGGSGNSGRWLVVAGYLADPSTGKQYGKPGIYALTPAVTPPKSAPLYDRLADLPVEPVQNGSETPFAASVPRVRPSGSSQNILPAAAQPPDNSLSAPIQPLPGSGVMLAAQSDANDSFKDAILRMNLDGSGKRIVLPPSAAISCPTLSPDAQVIAFTAQYVPGQNEIVFINSDGSNLNQQTAPDQPDETYRYDCPVWSPDGKEIAVVRHDPGSARLSVIGRENSIERIVQIDFPSTMSRPVWTPDGKAILLAEKAVGNNPAYIVSVDWQSTAGANIMHTLTGWNDVLALSLSPDGKQLALIATRAAPNSENPRVDFLVLPINETGIRISKELPGYDPKMQKLPGKIVWSSNNLVLFAQPKAWLSDRKAIFTSLDLTNNQINDLAFSPDALYDWDWKNGWLVYSNESGVWTQQVNLEKSAVHQPFHLSGISDSSLELK